MTLSPLVSLAKQVVERYVTSGKASVPAVALPDGLPARAACFVSIHRRDGTLRGCIGTVTAQESDLAQELTRNAIAACSRDPRFMPVTPAELPDLTYSVDILLEPEPICSVGDLNPKLYGVIVQQDWRRGLLLPDLPGVVDGGLQLQIALEKAGIPRDSEFQMSRFRVMRFQ